MLDGPGPGADSARLDPRTAAWTALVLLAGAALRAYAITGEMSADAVVYAQNAFNLLHGTFTLRDDSWYTHRLPVFAPVAAAYAAWGVGALSTHLWPLLLSVAQLALTLWLGVRLIGVRAGIVAGALLALLPLDAMQAGNLLPDGVMATLLTAAAAFWILGRDESGNRSRLLMFMSGVCLALAAVTRVYSIVLAALYLGDAVARPRPFRDLLWPLAGGLAVAVPLAAVYQVATGYALFPLHVVSEAYGSRLAPEGAHLLFYPSLLRHPETETAFYPPLFAAAVAFSVVRMDRARLPLLLWALPLLLYLEFGTMSFSSYVPIFKRTRFLTVLGAPLCLLAASMLCAAWDWMHARWRRSRMPLAWRAALAAAGVAALVACVADSLGVLAADRARRSAAAERTEEAVALLRSDPALPVLIDHWWTSVRLAYYFGFDEGSGFFRGADDRTRMAPRGIPAASRFRYLSWYPEPERLPSGFVVLDDVVLRSVARADSTSAGPFFAGEVPAYCYHPPVSWQRMRRIGTWTIYRSPAPAAPEPRPRAARRRGR